MTEEIIAIAAGVVLSVVFEVYPRAKGWFEVKTPAQKYLVMTGFGAGIVAVVLGLGCFDLFGLSEEFSCDQAGVEKAISLWVTYFMSNQTVFGAINMTKKQLGLS
jgi:hypothetical protein